MSNPTPPNTERERLTIKAAGAIIAAKKVGWVNGQDTTPLVHSIADLILAERQAATEDAVFKIMGPKTEGLFDAGDLFIKRAPIEKVMIELVGYEKYKAFQEAVDAQLSPPSPIKGGEE